MPVYIFKNNKTNEVYEKFLSMSEREGYLEDNPDIQQVPTAPKIPRPPVTSIFLLII